MYLLTVVTHMFRIQLKVIEILVQKMSDSAQLEVVQLIVSNLSRPILSKHQATVGRNYLLITVKKLLAELEPPSVWTSQRDERNLNDRIRRTPHYSHLLNLQSFIKYF